MPKITKADLEALKQLHWRIMCGDGYLPDAGLCNTLYNNLHSKEIATLFDDLFQPIGERDFNIICEDNGCPLYWGAGENGYSMGRQYKERWFTPLRQTLLSLLINILDSEVGEGQLMRGGIPRNGRGRT